MADELTREQYPWLRPKQRRAIHEFMWNGRMVFGKRECQCGSLENASIHRVPQVSDEQREAEARKVGERE